MTASPAAAPRSGAVGGDPALSLYHLLEPAVLANPYPLYRRLQSEAPVHWDPFLHVWVVTGYRDVVRVLNEFSASRTPTPQQLTALGLSHLNPIAEVMVKQMLFMDAADHSRLRSLASQAFTPHRVELLRAHIQDVTDRLLDRVAAARRFDVIADLAEPLPAIVSAEMLGVPVEDHSQLKAWSRDFAEMLGNGRSLVAIQTRGARPPLFAVPGVGGNVLCYGALARSLGADQPFYGLQSRGLDGSADPLTRIEDIAAAFVAEIKSVEPRGPYYLAGTCIGGVVAWEMAQQLASAGAALGLLALIETWPPAAAPTVRRFPGSPLLGFLARRLVMTVQTVRELRGRRRLSYLRERIRAVGHGIARRDLVGPNRPEFYQRLVARANLLALQRYRPRPLRGPVVLFRAEGRIPPGTEDARLAWRTLATDGLEIYTSPGDDSGLMLAEPHVGVLAAELARCLGRARSHGAAAAVEPAVVASL